MSSHRFWIACSLLALALPGGGRAEPPAGPGAMPTGASTAQPQRGAPGVEGFLPELAPWLATGRLLDAKAGELAGPGSRVVMAVLDPPAPARAHLGEGPGRVVVLLARDGRRGLHEVARNDRLVPCARCGGIAGDPYGYAIVEPGGFTIITEGGSRQRWSNAYSFAWHPARRTWTLREVRRTVVDRWSGRHRTLTLTPQEFGPVDFSAVDPATLPQATLP